MHTEQVANRNYKYCTLDCAEHGKFNAKVAFTGREWDVTEVEVDGEWIRVEEFDDTPPGWAYGCEDYRAEI